MGWVNSHSGDYTLSDKHRMPPCANCAVGGNIQAAIIPALDRAKAAMERELAAVALHDIAQEVAKVGRFSIPLTW